MLLQCVKLLRPCYYNSGTICKVASQKADQFYTSKTRKSQVCAAYQFRSSPSGFQMKIEADVFGTPGGPNNFVCCVEHRC